MQAHPAAECCFIMSVTHPPVPLLPTRLQGLAAVAASRCDALTHLQGQADEHMRWITGARAQPDNTTAALLEGVTPMS